MEDNNMFENNIESVELDSDENILVNGEYASEDYYRSRFSGAEWFNTISNLKVFIVGAGGIGSHTALNIAKLGCSICVNDFDTVEDVNMSGQLHPIRSIGSLKVDSTRDVVSDFCGRTYVSNKFNYINDNMLSLDLSDFVNVIKEYDIVIFALDSIDVRKEFFRNIRSLIKTISKPMLLIDGRLTAETLQVYTCKPYLDEHCVRYRETLFDSSESMGTVCSFKQTFYMASMIASIITNQVVNFAVNRISEMPSPQPFFIEYNSRTLDFKYEF